MARIQQYRARKDAARSQSPPLTVPDYEELQSIITKPGRANRPRLWRWGEKVDDAPLMRLAGDLLAESDPQRLLKYLHLFRKKAFPLDHRRLIELAHSEDGDIAQAARRALSNVSHPSVRALAEEIIASSSRLWEGIDLLINNFQEGDWQIIASLVTKDLPADECEYLGMSVRHCFEAHPTPDATTALMRLYENGHCAICRWDTVKLLDSLDAVPGWMWEECRYDADPALRKLAQEKCVNELSDL